MTHIRQLLTKKVLTVAMAAGLGLAAMPATTNAAEVFTVDPPVAPNFDADTIHGSYNEVLTITAFDGVNGTFETVAYWEVGNFELDGDDVASGEGAFYSVYALFEAGGTFQAVGTGFEFTATPGDGAIELWLDPASPFGASPPRTDNNLPATGLGGLASLHAVQVGGGDDILLATAVLESGDGDTSGGDAQGNFSLTFNPFLLTGAGAAFFIDPSPFYLTATLQGNFNDFDPLIVNQIIEGSANAQFVPEPASLVLLGLGLLGSGVAARRRRATSIN